MKAAHNRLQPARNHTQAVILIHQSHDSVQVCPPGPLVFDQSAPGAGLLEELLQPELPSFRARGRTVGACEVPSLGLQLAIAKHWLWRNLLFRPMQKLSHANVSGSSVSGVLVSGHHLQVAPCAPCNSKVRPNFGNMLLQLRRSHHAAAVPVALFLFSRS